MRTLLYAIGPMLFDSLGVIVFAILLAVGAGIFSAHPSADSRTMNDARDR